MSAEYDFAWAEPTNTSEIATGNIDDNSSVLLDFQFDAGAESGSGRCGPGRHIEVATAYAKLNEYAPTHHPTRPSSPQSVKTHEQFIQELGSGTPVGCDRLILDVFIGLFQRHVAPTFPHFKDFRVDNSTPEETYLAMAATGGLYCSLPRADVVAKWLLHKARRKLLTMVHSSAPESHSNYHLRVIQTYILMEIFSFVCGDKRMLLLLEVFHAQAIQALHTFIGHECRGRSLDANEGSLVQSMYLLECYRVVLLQQPTMRYTTSVLRETQMTPLGVAAPQSTESCDIPLLLRAITAYDAPGVHIQSDAQSMQSLCALSILVSNHQRLPGSLSRLLQSDDRHFETPTQDWRDDFAEISLQKWLVLHSKPPSADTMLLYHLIHLNIYASFAEIEMVARTATESSKNEGPPIVVDKSQPLSFSKSSSLSRKVVALKRCFTSRERSDKAAWHARRLLDIAPSMQDLRPGSPGDRIHLARGSDAIRSSQPLHFSFAVYYSCMILWSLEFLETHSQGTKDAIGTSSPLRKGSNLLSQSTSRVAENFKQILESLQDL